jgi:ferrochelatase
MAKQAVLLLAHGTPETVEQIPEYLRNVVSGRPCRRRSSKRFSTATRSSAAARSPKSPSSRRRLVEAELAAQGHPAPRLRRHAQLAPLHSRCGKADARRRRGRGAGLCLAPQNSRTSVGLYRRAVEAEAGNLRIDFTEGWAAASAACRGFAERLRAAEAKLTTETGAPWPVLFTAHSVPCRTVQSPAADSGPRLWPAGQGPDPYATDAKRTARLVAERVPEIPRWWFAFQSQGASGGPWIGPIGIRLERPESLNASPTLAQAVADLAAQGLVRLQG